MGAVPDAIAAFNGSIREPPGPAASPLTPSAQHAGEPVVDFETVRIRKDGTEIQVSMSSSPIRDANGDFRRVLNGQIRRMPCAQYSPGQGGRQAEHRPSDDFGSETPRPWTRPLVNVRGRMVNE